jgi:hypothetical protein
MSFHKFNRILLPALILFCLKGATQTPAEQKKADAYAQLKSWIESKKFRFKAQSATPQRGRTINLTTEYFLQINNDSLSVELPYYGRAYSSSYPGTNSPLSFKSTHFSYVADTLKKGGWNIQIQPKDNTDVNKINLEITTSGYCTVRVSSNTRDMISFYGTIAQYGMR